jgi:hypothetical protein
MRPTNHIFFFDFETWEGNTRLRFYLRSFETINTSGWTQII